MKIRFPPVLKLLVRGYLIIAALYLLYESGIIRNLALTIFAITVVSISMVFGVGVLLINLSKPVRSGNCDIPNTVLVFVKGALLMYFISLLGAFSLVPLEITGLLLSLVALGLVLFGTLSYVLEVFERTIPVKRCQFTRPVRYVRKVENARQMKPRVIESGNVVRPRAR